MPKSSPFPGMDPYLEDYWPDVHTKLITYSADAMNRVLPEDLVAHSEERVSVAGGDEADRQYGPDVRVFEHYGISQAKEAGDTDGGVATLVAPVRLVLGFEPEAERSVQIVEVHTQRLITVVEFLSPANKRGTGIEEFQKKRRELLAAGVNFVEVDLVRAGNCRALLRPHVCPARFAALYRAIIRTPADPAAVGLYPITLREPLPPIVIPLRQRDPQVRLELQPLIAQVYENGRYGRLLDYGMPLDPALTVEDAAWASEILITPSPAPPTTSPAAG